MTWSLFARHQPADAVAWCHDGRCQSGSCLGFCTKDRATRATEAANWFQQGATVICVYDARIMGDTMVGRVGTIERLCGAVFEDHCYEVFPPVGRQRAPREGMMELRQLQPFEPEAAWRPVLCSEQVRVLAAIQADPSAPNRWGSGPDSRRRSAQTLAALGIVGHPPGKKAWREPWWITDRGHEVLKLLATASDAPEGGMHDPW